jgi:glycosyltransferase involved in cell wall biosynthesis
MRIIIISGTAPPEPMPAGRIHFELAKFLSEDNNQVWFVSPKPSRPLGTRYPETGRDNIIRISDNLSHIQLNSYTYPGSSVLKRTYESIDFGFKAIRYINKKIKKYDLIYSSPWAFLGQFLILALRKGKNYPVIMNVQDLYPESFLVKVNSGILKRILHPLYLIDIYNARKSSCITVISENLKQVYLQKRKISESKINVIHNWQHGDAFYEKLQPKEEILKKYNMQECSGKFVYMYLGNIGHVAGVEIILNSFVELNNTDSFLVIAGSGTTKERCMLLARKLKISNLAFIDVPPDMRSVAEIQSIANIMLLPINPGAAHSSIPSKLITYMFSAKPVITSASSSSDTAEAVRSSGCGWITKSNHPEDWIEMMNKAYMTDSTGLTKIGKSGYDFAVENYSRENGLNKLSRLIYSFKRE